MESLGDWVRVPQLRLRFGLITVGWAFLLWQAIELFRPDSSLLPTYSSDDAIPLLMANEPRMTPFSLFYYGQDRFGAWPFLLARALGWIGHFSWSPELLSAYLTLFMFAAAWPLWALARKTDFIVPGYLGVLLLNPVVQIERDPYGWQASTLIWTWWALRRLSSNRNSRSWFVAASIGSIMAVWISPLSCVILIALATLEWAFQRRASGPQAAPGRMFLILMIPPAIGLCIETMLRAWFHQYSRLRFHFSYANPIALDSGHVLRNASAMWNVLVGRPWWIVQFGLVCGAGFFLLIWLAQPRHRAPPTTTENALRALAVGCAAICVLTFAASVAVSHVRQNYYHERYLTLGHLFGGIGAVAAIAAMLPVQQISAKVRNGLSIALSVALTVSIAVWLPRFRSNPAYAELKAAAEWLGSQPVPSVLGGYWGTYVFAALALPKRVTPIPVGEDYQRTPWTTDAIHWAEQVVISTYGSDRFGPANDPDRWVTDRDEFFKRSERAGWSKGAVTFWMYANATKRSLPISSPLSVPNWDACGEKSLSIDVGGIQSGELVYWTQPPPPRLVVLGESEHGRTRPPDAFEQGARMTGYFFENGAALSRMILQPIERRQGCVLDTLAVFKR